MTKEEIEKEIERLTKTVNALPMRLGGMLLQKIAVLLRQLENMNQIKRQVAERTIECQKKKAQ